MYSHTRARVHTRIVHIAHAYRAHKGFPPTLGSHASAVGKRLLRRSKHRRAFLPHGHGGHCSRVCATTEAVSLPRAACRGSKAWHCLRLPVPAHAARSLRSASALHASIVARGSAACNFDRGRALSSSGELGPVLLRVAGRFGASMPISRGPPGRVAGAGARPLRLAPAAYQPQAGPLSGGPGGGRPSGVMMGRLH
jgi:hypothetical protein